MSKTLWVVWGKPGIPRPMIRKARRIDPSTGRDRRCVYDEPVEVPNVRYYRRRIATGDLQEVEEGEPIRGDVHEGTSLAERVVRPPPEALSPKVAPAATTS